MYERLTKWEVEGCASVNGCSPLDADMAKAINRLCDLEDKIEQGKIVELPCTVGDKMYLINASQTRVHPYIVTHLEVCESGIKIFGRQIACNVEHWLCWDSDLGNNDWVFRTEAEANNKLKELENEQR